MNMLTAVQGVPGRHFRSFHRATVNCSVETAWDVFTDHEGQAEFKSSHTQLIKEGETDRNGLGAITASDPRNPAYFQVREVVNYWIPHRVYGWHQIDPGKPNISSHHQGVIRFFPRGENRCEWVYDMRLILTPEIQEAVPGLYDKMLSKFRELMWDYESECERRGHEIEIPAFPPPIDDQAIERGPRRDG